MYMLVTFIYYIIIVYIVAKVFGVVFRFFRSISGSGRQQQRPAAQQPRSRAKEPYPNVEDVDYEDITDQK